MPTRPLLLTLTQSPERPLSIISDPRRLRQILLNLLSNAIKFGRGRPIEVTCTRTPDNGVAIGALPLLDRVPPIV